jgi:phage terminase Nu1 subunit (DNA packaging protein)
MYPLFEALLRHKGVPSKGMYTNKDMADLFDVSVRTIQAWVTEGRLAPRKLPGRGRFLAEDIESFLQNSKAKADDPRGARMHETRIYRARR